MQITEILSKIETREANGSISIGTIKEVFPTHMMRLVRQSSTGAKRASVLMEKDGKQFVIVVAENLTPFVRNGNVDEKHIANFPLYYSEELNTIFVGMPKSGWVAVEDIEVEDFDMSDFAH